MKGLLGSARTMRSRGVALLVIASMLLAAVPVSADAVIRADPVDLLPDGDFEDAGAWSLSTNKAYVTDVAEYTTAMVTDGHLSMTHSRAQNHADMTVWSSDSPSDDLLATGMPDCMRPATDPVCDNDLDGDSDGGYAWSKGPVIETEGFDLSAGATYPLNNVSLVVAFRVPASLSQDSVRVIVQSEGVTHLVKTYAHTMGEINYMQNNAKHFPLESLKDWTWDELSNITVTMDYVSVGEFDDSELQVDAVGLWVRYLQPWGTFEMAKASHTVTFDAFPVMPMDLADGVHSNLSLTPCGLEGVGSWESDSIERPYAQDWGRFHPTVTGNASWKIQSSTDDVNWGAWTVISEGDDLPIEKHLRVEGTLFDGCIESVKVDLNDPTLTLNGMITGSGDSMVTEFAKIRFAMNGEEVAAFDIAPGPFSAAIPVGHLLDVGGGDIDIGVAARFHWSSNGSADSIVVDVEDMSIGGGFEIEWDLDPVCESQPDQSFSEDGGGRLIDFRFTCTDDYTDADDLIITASSDSPGIIEASIVNDQIRLQPQPDMHGVADVTIVVVDERGNIWTDNLTALITPVDDAPEMDVLPVVVSIEVGDVLQLPFGYSDRDTDAQFLTFNVTPDWAVVSGGMLWIAPTVAGSHFLTVSLSDGTTTIDQRMTVTATLRADLWVQSIELSHIGVGEGDLTDGDDVLIEVYVKNDGQTMAQPVTVRCTVDGLTVDTDQIGVIEPLSLETAQCEWAISGSGNVTLSIEIDWTDEIDETNEVNNLISYPLVVEPGVENPGTPSDASESESKGDGNSKMLWGGLIIVGLFGLALLQLGPGRIRRIE